MTAFAALFVPDALREALFDPLGYLGSETAVDQALETFRSGLWETS